VKHLLTVPLTALLLLLSAATVKAQTITPYLQAPTPSSMWVTWYTTSGTESKVIWGTSPTALTNTVTGVAESLSAQYILHHVQLTGLSANTVYYYQTITGTQTSAVTRFISAPAYGTNTGRIHYIVYGDTQDPTAVARVAPKIEEKCRQRFGNNWEDSVRFVIKLGDNVDVGGNLDQWKNLHFGCVKYVSGRIPVMTVPGNHEYYGDATLANYFAHTKYENIAYKSISRADGENYYAWQYANMLFIMFNSNETWTRQTDWVRNVVTAANTDASVSWVFAASHHPNYVEQYPSDGSSYIVNNIVPELMKTSKMAVEYSGHSHLYSRGAAKDSAFHQIINGGSSWIQRWGQDPNQTDFENVQKTIDHYLFQLVTMDLGQKKMITETYSNGTDTYVMNNYLIDTYIKDLNALSPVKPAITVPASVTLPYTFQAGPYNGAITANSTEFQIVDSAGSFVSPSIRSKRDFENIYLASNPNAYSPIDQNAGVDMFKYTAALNSLASGKNKIRVRFRDQNMKWSAWSDSVMFVVTNGAPPASQVAIAYYPFNNNTNDESGFNRHAVNTGVTFVNDANRQQLTGVFNNAYATVASGAIPSWMPKKNMTVSCWVKTTAVNNHWGGLFGLLQDNGSTENGWLLGSLGQQFSFALRSENGAALTYLTDPSSFTLNTWYNLTASYDGTKMKLYVNGQLKAESAIQSGRIVYPSSGWLTIGQYKDSDEDFRHNGSLDEIKLWERTLTNQEVLDLYTSSTTNPQPLAEFIADKTTITAGQSVTFTNVSHHANAYSWSFPGGTPAASTTVNPVITYATPGQFDVTLTANGAGGSNTQTKTKYITVHAASGVPLPSGTIVYYPMTNNFNDSSGNNYHATVSGNPAYGTRNTNTYADLDNATSGDILTGTAAVAIQPKTAITAMCWVRVDAADVWGGFVGCVQDNGVTEFGWVLGTRNNRFSFALRSVNPSATALTYLTDPATFNLGQWYHVAATYDGTTMKLYVDGQLKASSTDQAGDIRYASSHWFTLGRYKDEDEDFRHDGGLDEVYVVNRALTAAEIGTVMGNASAAVNLVTRENEQTPVQQPVPADQLTIYPVPAGKEVNLVIPVTDEELSYQVSDITGRTVKTGTVVNPSKTVIATGDLPKGVYTITVTGRNTKLSKNFVKN